jgi:hypothetical protein
MPGRLPMWSTTSTPDTSRRSGPVIAQVRSLESVRHGGWCDHVRGEQAYPSSWNRRATVLPSRPAAPVTSTRGSELTRPLRSATTQDAGFADPGEGAERPGEPGPVMSKPATRSLCWLATRSTEPDGSTRGRAGRGRRSPRVRAGSAAAWTADANVAMLSCPRLDDVHPVAGRGDHGPRRASRPSRRPAKPSGSVEGRHRARHELGSAPDVSSTTSVLSSSQTTNAMRLVGMEREVARPGARCERGLGGVVEPGGRVGVVPDDAVGAEVDDVDRGAGGGRGTAQWACGPSCRMVRSVARGARGPGRARRADRRGVRCRPPPSRTRSWRRTRCRPSVLRWHGPSPQLGTRCSTRQVRRRRRGATRSLRSTVSLTAYSTLPFGCGVRNVGCTIPDTWAAATSCGPCSPVVRSNAVMPDGDEWVVAPTYTRSTGRSPGTHRRPPARVRHVGVIRRVESVAGSRERSRERVAMVRRSEMTSSLDN